MQAVQIKISGGDSAHWRKMTLAASQTWIFPDGITRAVTMSGWHWHAFSQLIATHQKEEFIARCFDFAQSEYVSQIADPESVFDLEFEEWIQKVIRDFIRWDDRLNKPRANDNGVYDLEFLFSE